MPQRAAILGAILVATLAATGVTPGAAQDAETRGAPAADRRLDDVPIANEPATGGTSKSDRRLDHVPVAAGPIAVDGAVDEPAWQGALRLALPHETFPGDNVAAQVGTDVLVLHDASTLYVAFIAQDPDPGSIRAHLADRDDAFRDDLVGFVLDTFDDARRGVAFFSNPLGVQLDASIDEAGGGERRASAACSASSSTPTR